VTVLDPGYGVFEGVFSFAELTPITAALDGCLATRSRAGARHLLALPEVRDLTEDPRLVRLAEAFVGNARPFRATLFDKSSSSNWLVVWHQDTALPMQARVDAEGWGPWSTKAGVHYAHAPAAALTSVVALRISLDDSTETNGPLRILPGTHAQGLLDQATIDELARTVPAAACTVRRGGIVAMRPLVLHASSKSSSDAPRRVLHLEYAATTRFGAGLDLAMA
jgi:hypothetical protein